VSIAIGSVILIPSLALLFALVLRGRFDERPDEPGSLGRAERHPIVTGPPASEPGRRAGVAAAVCAALGVPLTVLSDAGPTLVAGVVLLLVAVAAAVVFVVPQITLPDTDDS
jgi:hypothetical protein